MRRRLRITSEQNGHPVFIHDADTGEDLSGYFVSGTVELSPFGNTVTLVAVNPEIDVIAVEGADEELEAGVEV